MKKKLMFLVKDKGFSGVEREVITLANSLVSLYDISIFFVNDTNKFVEIDKKIKVLIYDKPFIQLKSFYYKNLFKNQDVIISTNVMFNKYLVKHFNNKKIFWEHNHPDNIVKDDYVKNMEYFDYIVVPNKAFIDIYNNVNKNIIIINDAIKIKSLSNNLLSKNIIFIGSIVKNKKINELIEVIKMVNKKIKVNLNIVGIGEEKNNLEDYVKKNNLDYIKFLGNLSEEELDNLLMNSSIFVTCSVAESFGVSILSSMCIGIPVIAFDDVQSLKDVIIDGINGFLIKNRNKEEMVDKIIMLLTDNDMLKSFGNCSKEKVLEYDINSIKREWIKII